MIPSFYIYSLTVAMCLFAAPAAFSQAKQTATQGAAAAGPATVTAEAAATAAPAVSPATVDMTTSITTNATEDVIANLINAPEHATFISTLESVKLTEVLKGKGPFTIIAPTNDAFRKMPAGMFTYITEKDTEVLEKMLKYHVIGAKLNGRKIMQDIKSGKGKARYRTLSGARLTFSLDDYGMVIVTDDLGNIGRIGAYDLVHSNGIVHVIDNVMIPQEFK